MHGGDEHEDWVAGTLAKVFVGSQVAPLATCVHPVQQVVVAVGLEKSRADSFLRAGFRVVRGSACLLRDPFWIETLVGYS